MKGLLPKLVVDNTTQEAVAERLRAANKAAAAKILLSIKASLDSTSSISYITTATSRKNTK